LENWTWGLTLIALTMTIHAAAMAAMAFATTEVRVRLDTKNCVGLPHVFAITIALIGAIGLLWLRSPG
jgi:hypothetical protein